MLPPLIEQIYFDKGYYTIILVCLLDILNIYLIILIYYLNGVIKKIKEI